jgi:hypothetical protein
MHTILPTSDATEREHFGGSTLFWAGKCCDHLIDSQLGLNIINSLSPFSVCFGEGGVVVLASLIGLDGINKGNDSAETKNEWIRFRAPELTSGSLSIGNDQTVSFTLAMTLYSILSVEFPFPRVDSATASKKMVSGERPNWGGLKTGHKEITLIFTACFSDNMKERYPLSKMNDVLLQMMPELQEDLNHAVDGATLKTSASSSESSMKEQSGY